jgi:hypothetical protein
VWLWNQELAFDLPIAARTLPCTNADRPGHRAPDVRVGRRAAMNDVWRSVDGQHLERLVERAHGLLVPTRA